MKAAIALLLASLPDHVRLPVVELLREQGLDLQAMATETMQAFLANLSASHLDVLTAFLADHLKRRRFQAGLEDQYGIPTYDPDRLEQALDALLGR
jgi:hypothetical protein